MSEREALLRAVRAAQDDDTPRLILADWYEENDDPDRAAYIRTAVRVARLGQEDCAEKVWHRPPGVAIGRLIRCGACEFCTGMRSLNAYHEGGNIQDDLGLGYAHTPETGAGTDPDVEWPVLFYSRGFVGRVHLPAEAFTPEFAARLFSIHPVATVRVTRKRPENVSWAAPHSKPWTWFVGDANWPHSPHHVTNAIWHHLPATWYESEADALAAFGRACVAWGREAASDFMRKVPA